MGETGIAGATCRMVVSSVVGVVSETGRWSLEPFADCLHAPMAMHPCAQMQLGR